LEVTFDDSGLGKIFESDRGLRKNYGTVRAKKIQTRMTALRAAETLEDMRSLPGHCHELGPGSGLDWRLVTAVVITTIVDYH
jgi:plasmid maintenance system killer protein